MNRLIVFFLFLLSSCYESGYHPSYIISHGIAEEEGEQQDEIKSYTPPSDLSSPSP